MDSKYEPISDNGTDYIALPLFDTAETYCPDKQLNIIASCAFSAHFQPFAKTRECKLQ